MRTPEEGVPALTRLIDMFLETAPAHVADIRRLAATPERMAAAGQEVAGLGSLNENGAASVVLDLSVPVIRRWCRRHLLEGQLT